VNRLQAFLDEQVAEGVVSAATALVGTAEGIAWSGWAGTARRPERAAGSRTARPARPAGWETIYDFGSLAKPFVGTLALRLDADGRLPLAEEIGESWPAAHPHLARRTLEDLLRHRAGVAAWTPLYVRCRALAPIFEIEELLLGGSLLGAPADTYSDLDFRLWGLTAVRRLGRPLEDLLRAEVLAPLGLGVLPPPGEIGRAHV